MATLVHYHPDLSGNSAFPVTLDSTKNADKEKRTMLAQERVSPPNTD